MIGNDPELALAPDLEHEVEMVTSVQMRTVYVVAHALVARRKASRIAAVREAAGLAAYHAGEWQIALGELRTYHRMTGRQTHVAVLADCERALGRPEKAIDLFRTAEREKLGAEEIVELLIVAAGARGDLGQNDAAVAMLQVRELTAAPEAPWAARLRYAYADALLRAGRRDESREWFARAAEIDNDVVTDAAERLLEIDGIVLEGDEDDDYDDETAEDDEYVAEEDEADEYDEYDTAGDDVANDDEADEDVDDPIDEKPADNEADYEADKQASEDDGEDDREDDEGTPPVDQRG